MNVVHNAAQFAVALDCALNVVVSTLTLQVAYAGETLSAHAFRAERADKLFGRFFRPLIDALFLWQAPDPRVTHADGSLVTGHCERAFMKAKQHLYLPPEYRSTTTERAPQ